MGQKLIALVLLLGAMGMVVSASAGSVQIHLLKTGNDTYVYTAQMSPVICTTSCNVTYADTADCDNVILARLDKIYNETRDCTAVAKQARDAVGDLKTNITGSIESIPSLAKIGELFDTQRTQLGTHLSTVITDKMNEYDSRVDDYFSRGSELDQLRERVSQLNVDVENANNRAATAEQNEAAALERVTSMEQIAMGATALAVFMFLVSFNLISVVVRKIKGGE
jgi:hypothetical protein